MIVSIPDLCTLTNFYSRVSCFQSGFGTGRRTTDNLVGFEDFIRGAFVGGEHVVSVYFGLEGLVVLYGDAAL